MVFCDLQIGTELRIHPTIYGAKFSHHPSSRSNRKTDLVCPLVLMYIGDTGASCYIQIKHQLSAVVAPPATRWKLIIDLIIDLRLVVLC
jgi:hypothetical protein